MLGRRGIMCGVLSAGAAAALPLSKAQAAVHKVRWNWWGNPERDRRTAEAIKLYSSQHPDVQLIGEAADHLRGRSVDLTLDHCAQWTAQWRQRLIAVARVAIPLTERQRERLIPSPPASPLRLFQMVLRSPLEAGPIYCCEPS